MKLYREQVVKLHPPASLTPFGNRKMKAKDAKKMICACKMRQGKETIVCGRRATITFRIETTGGPEFMTFCNKHIRRAEQAIHEVRKILED